MQRRIATSTFCPGVTFELLYPMPISETNGIGGLSKSAATATQIILRNTHKVVYDYKTLRDVFEKAGFVVDLLEYCDENGVFHYKYWNELDGKIGRSLRFDTRNQGGKLGMVSIIIDAKKPLIIGG